MFTCSCVYFLCSCVDARKPCTLRSSPIPHARPKMIQVRCGRTTMTISNDLRVPTRARTRGDRANCVISNTVHYCHDITFLILELKALARASQRVRYNGLCLVIPNDSLGLGHGDRTAARLRDRVIKLTVVHFRDKERLFSS